MPGAGRLRDRVTIQKYVGTDDGYGNVTGEWVDQFTAAANIAYLRGGESVMASRLAAKQPAILTIRTSVQARGVQPDWRALNARTGEAFQIREKPRETKESRGYLEALCESGVAT